MLGAQNSLGPVCPVPLTVRGTRSERFSLAAAGEVLRLGHGGARMVSMLTARLWVNPVFLCLLVSYRPLANWHYPPPLTTHAPTPSVKAFQTACIDTGTNTFRVCA